MSALAIFDPGEADHTPLAPPRRAPHVCIPASPPLLSPAGPSDDGSPQHPPSVVVSIEPSPTPPPDPDPNLNRKDGPQFPPWSGAWLPTLPLSPALSPPSPPLSSPCSTSSSSYASVFPGPPPLWQTPAAPLWSMASVRLALRVGVLFLLSTVVVAAGVLSLPFSLPTGHGRGLDAVRNLKLSEIRAMATALRTYAHATWPAAAHTSLALAALYLWKQAWTFPGTVVLNVLLGMIYGTYLATVYTSLLTATGGVLCYLLCRPLIPVLEQLPGVQKPLVAMRRALPGRSAGDQRSMPAYLFLLRLVPIVPWGPMNMCCAMLGVPLGAFWASFLLGSVPWNFVTAQVGEILHALLDAAGDAEGEAAGLSVITAKLYSREMLLKLSLLTLASLVPLAVQCLVKRRRSPTSHLDGAGADADGDGHSGSLARTWDALPLTHIVTPHRRTKDTDKLLPDPARTPSPRIAIALGRD